MLLNHGATSEPILFEKGFTVREHAEYTTFVKEAVYNLVIAYWIIQYVPKGVLKIKQSLLEVPRKCRVVERDVMSGCINEL